MKKEYSRVLKKLLIEEMQAHGFIIKARRIKSEFVFPGEAVFELNDFVDVRVFIILIPHVKENGFTIEVAWSTLDRFPELGVRPNDLLATAESACEFAIRLPTIAGLKHEFWVVPEEKGIDPLDAIIKGMNRRSEQEVLEELEPLVRDSVQILKDVGLPWLKSILMKQYQA